MLAKVSRLLMSSALRAASFCCPAFQVLIALDCWAFCRLACWRKPAFALLTVFVTCCWLLALNWFCLFVACWFDRFTCCWLLALNWFCWFVAPALNWFDWLSAPAFVLSA